MMRLRYYLHVDVAESQVPGDVIHAIHTEAEPQDRDWSQQVQRFIGGSLDTCAESLSRHLGDGFAVRVDDAPVADRVFL